MIEKRLEDGKNFTGFLAAIREKLQDSYWQVLGEEQAGTISAITLGDRSGLPEEIKTIYQEGGIAHVLAISSLHITLLGRGLYRLLRKKQAVFSDVGHPLSGADFFLLPDDGNERIRPEGLPDVWALGGQPDSGADQ